MQTVIKPKLHQLSIAPKWRTSATVTSTAVLSMLCLSKRHLGGAARCSSHRLHDRRQGHHRGFMLIRWLICVFPSLLASLSHSLHLELQILSGLRSLRFVSRKIQLNLFRLSLNGCDKHHLQAQHGTEGDILQRFVRETLRYSWTGCPDQHRGQNSSVGQDAPSWTEICRSNWPYIIGNSCLLLLYHSTTSVETQTVCPILWFYWSSSGALQYSEFPWIWTPP